ncbi:GNAT family N-acetyltransferase [Stappia sp. 28M-7]|uniref:GNAT family N-acetyltransferase n=1 Tax=Stappia sp. 28M-7 TaxID=2762596 RepID=UPI000E71290B|nr:GNAT family N-acetyltransferase [Stappia sp. 28M-7]MBC2857741.1 GNAT family N-acetyltransferase [Stappia sp. 28M-7]
MSTLAHPLLKSARLTLRAPVASDLDRLAKLANDADIARVLERLPHPYSREDGETWLAGIGRDPAKFELAIDDGSGFVGALSLRGLDETPVIGYWLGRPFWGHGYMSEAAGTALAWIFGAGNAQAVEARVMTENTASRNVLEKLGFRDIGGTECTSLACGISRPARCYRLDRTTFEYRNRGHAPVQA